MRFGPSMLLALVLLAFPATAGAKPSSPETVDAEPQELTPAVEYTLLGQYAADERVKAELEKTSLGRAAAALAVRYLGTPYSWAGSSPAGFDCSGFVMYVYGRLGVRLPHSSSLQYRLGRAVPRSRLEPGDLVFFNGLTHVGIYVGQGRFIHSPHSGDVVKFSRLTESWYRSSYYGARRLRPTGRV